ncbi:hypothetical protein P43SY_006534 [Pythium insidiosum]|uniref:Uncharacterized protein n=1 Tax=Pythium insidiosum TaxID=114742 RepID=A0AAD5LI87_PYTIN|nr:hypothetical protein P43SY_006534 [Pythium insidiosum]
MGNTCSSERAVATTKHTTTNARVLSADTNSNERILVTGASGQLGRATLRHLLETLRGITAATGWPEAVTTILASFDVNAAAGFAGDVTDDFFQLTGQRPQSFAMWLQQHKTQFQA